jgi:glutathione S-transferase
MASDWRLLLETSILVSAFRRDKHLLALNPFRGIPVLRPHELLAHS